MKIPFANLFQKHQTAPSPIGPESPFRDDLSREHIERVNNQIRQFARHKAGVDAALAQHREMQRSYDASITTNFNADFKGTYTSGNAEILSSDYQVVARSRTIAKDTPQGKAIMRTLANNVVGHDPFKLDMRFGAWEKKADADAGGHSRKFVEDEEVNTAIETEWGIFGQPENFTNKMNMSRMEAWRILEMSSARDGFVFGKHHRGFPMNEYGYAVELLERDRLQSQFYGQAEGTRNPIRFSIEFDKQWNYPVAYWLLAMHPGDCFGQSQMAGYTLSGYPAQGLESGQLFRIRIPAKDIVMFNNLRDRAEQDVGFPEMDATIQALWRIFQYEKALTYAAIASCMKVYWYKKNFPTGLNMDGMEFEKLVDNWQKGQYGPVPQGAPGAGGDAVKRQEGLQPRVTAEAPGSTLDLMFGMELMQTDPKFPIEAAHEFRQDNLRDIAVGAGVRYQDVSGDFQNLGFAAALMCSTPAQDNYKVRQKNFIDCVVRPIFRVWLRCAIMSGVFDRKYPGLDISIAKVEEYVQSAWFKGKRWAFVNPLVQAQCLIIMLEAGIMSPQQVQDQLEDGVSIEKLYTMLEEANDEQKKHNLNYAEVDVTRPTVSKGDPGEAQATPAEAAAPAKTKPANPVRARGVTPLTLSLIDQQGDGTDKNGAHH